jgi:hypothetical protein
MLSSDPDNDWGRISLTAHIYRRNSISESGTRSTSDAKYPRAEGRRDWIDQDYGGAAHSNIDSTNGPTALKAARSAFCCKADIGDLAGATLIRSRLVTEASEGGK